MNSRNLHDNSQHNHRGGEEGIIRVRERDMKEKITHRFDIDETDNEAIFPLRYINNLPYIIVNKKDFKVFETEHTYVIEAVDNTDRPCKSQ